jgi:hypothetical protein
LSVLECFWDKLRVRVLEEKEKERIEKKLKFNFLKNIFKI